MGRGREAEGQSPRPHQVGATASVPAGRSPALGGSLGTGGLGPRISVVAGGAAAETAGGASDPAASSATVGEQKRTVAEEGDFRGERARALARRRDRDGADRRARLPGGGGGGGTHALAGGGGGVCVRAGSPEAGGGGALRCLSPRGSAEVRFQADAVT